MFLLQQTINQGMADIFIDININMFNFSQIINNHYSHVPDVKASAGNKEIYQII